jgi:two-component system chemotaxis response regulator CheV
MENTSTVLLESDTNELEIVEFRIDERDEGGQLIPCHYGVNVAKVREIIRLPRLWQVFNSHPAVPGMIKLRDKVITIIDLAKVLNKRTDGLKADRVVVLEFNKLTVGMLVHSVSRIYRISWDDVEPPVKVADAKQVTGLVKLEDRIILVLDFERIVGELCHNEILTPLDEAVTGDGRALERAKHRILVADDSPFIRKALTAALCEAGYRVTEVDNGEDAWEHIAAAQARRGTDPAGRQEEVSLLITDVEMPRMDGLHLTSRVRRDPSLAKLPVIIFSSLASEDNIRKWRSLGANHILTKPELPNLVSITDSLLIPG